MQTKNSYFRIRANCLPCFREFAKFACMASKSVEDFLNDLEPELNKYAKSLRDQGFTSTNMLKFLKLKDLQNIPFVVPAPHRRMILSAVAKLQSPGSKFQIESPLSTTVEKNRERAKREKQMGELQPNIKSKLQKNKVHLHQKRSFLMEHYRPGTIPHTTLFYKIS